MLPSQGIFWLALAGTVLAAPTSSSSSSSASKASDPPAFFGAITADGFTSQKWIDALEKARSVVAGLTFEQKVRPIKIGSTPGT